MTHEEKVALSVVGIGAAALIAYLASRGPAASGTDQQVLPIGLGGTATPDTIEVGGGSTPGTDIFPGFNVPGLVNNGIPYIGSGPLQPPPALTATNPYLSQCSCSGVGLNQIYYASVPALVAAQQASPAAAPAPSGGGIVAALKQAASYFTIPPASTVGIPAGGSPAIPSATEGLSYV